MKNYEEVAESVFKRSEEMIAQNKRRRRDRLINIVATVSCLAVAGAVGIGVWKTVGQSGAQVVSDIYLPQSGANAAASQFANDEQDNINEDYLIVDRYIPSDSSGIDAVGAESSEISSAESSEISSVENSEISSAESSVITNDEISGVSDTVFPALSQSVPTSDSEPEPVKVLTVIEEYGAADTIPDSAPENGTVLLTDALKDAMEAYGYMDENGDITYHVAAYYYDNGVPVDANLSDIREYEWNRLCGHGYLCEFETCGRNWGSEVEHHFCMRLTREQLESFVPAENYGCTLCLYGECKRRCILSQDDTENSVTSVPQNQGYHHDWGTGNGNGYGYGNGYGGGHHSGGHHGGHC